MEAKLILREVLHREAWERIDKFREELAASGREFGDSMELIREDRDR